jgi:hypothetical protein
MQGKGGCPLKHTITSVPLIFGLSLSLPFGAAAQDSERSPGEVVRAFYAALASQDCAQAKSLLTAERLARIQILVGGRDAFQRYCRYPFTGELTGKVVQRTEIEHEQPLVSGDVVSVSYTLHFTDGSQHEQPVWVIRECGTWKLMDKL